MYVNDDSIHINLPIYIYIIFIYFSIEWGIFLWYASL